MPTNAQPGENSVTIVKKLNHFAIVCRSTKKNRVHTLSEEVKEDNNFSGTREEDTNACNIFLGECNSNKYSNVWKVDINIEGNTNAVFKVDTGADVTVINHKTFSQISGQKLQPTTKKLISPAGNIKILGTVTGYLTYKNKAIMEMFYVLDPTNKTGNLLSRKASVQLNIVKFIGSFSIKDDDIF